MNKTLSTVIALLFAFVTWLIGPLTTTTIGQETSPSVAQGEAAYQNGEYATAHRLWIAAANQNDASAKFNLGVMYVNGRGVPQDYVAAHMWFNLAAAQGDATAAEYRDNIARRMSPAQIADAQKMAREWKAAARSGPPSGIVRSRGRP